MRIAIFGLGYVGTVTAAGLASQGHEVWGVDVDQVKVDHIQSGRSPVVEPGIDELIATAVDRGTLRATTDPVAALEGADVWVLPNTSGLNANHRPADFARAFADVRRAATIGLRAGPPRM